jgi:hypothetical protein
VGATKKRANWGRNLSIKNVTKNLPDCSIGVMNLRFDHIPKLIDIFLDVKHRQRHGASEPQRRLRKVEPWTWTQKNNSGSAASVVWRRGRARKGLFRAESTEKATRGGG